MVRYIDFIYTYMIFFTFYLFHILCTILSTIQHIKVYTYIVWNVTGDAADVSALPEQIIIYRMYVWVGVLLKPMVHEDDIENQTNRMSQKMRKDFIYRYI